MAHLALPMPPSYSPGQKIDHPIEYYYLPGGQGRRTQRFRVQNILLHLEITLLLDGSDPNEHDYKSVSSFKR